MRLLRDWIALILDSAIVKSRNEKRSNGLRFARAGSACSSTVVALRIKDAERVTLAVQHQSCKDAVPHTISAACSSTAPQRQRWPLLFAQHLDPCNELRNWDGD